MMINTMKMNKMLRIVRIIQISRLCHKNKGKNNHLLRNWQPKKFRLKSLSIEVLPGREYLLLRIAIRNVLQIAF